VYGAACTALVTIVLDLHTKSIGVVKFFSLALIADVCNHHGMTPIGLERAIAAAGSSAALARAIGVSRQVVTSWKMRGNVPIKNAYKISRKYRIALRDLCPKAFKAYEK